MLGDYCTGSCRFALIPYGAHWLAHLWADSFPHWTLVRTERA